jgi:hypothetical protein
MLSMANTQYSHPAVLGSTNGFTSESNWLSQLQLLEPQDAKIYMAE